MRQLDPARVHFERAGDTLSLQVTGGAFYPRVALRRCFPVSDDSRFISVRDASLENCPEIGIVVDCESLPERERSAVLEELHALYFVPRIQRVLEIKEEFGFFHWQVETDRGRAKFVMRDGIITYTREVGPGHWLLIDLNQSRWEITDLDALDTKSQRLIRRVLYI